MNDFKECLENNKEIGRVVAFTQNIAHISGLPRLRVGEMVVTESGKTGVVHGLDNKVAEVLIINPKGLRAKEAVARSGKLFKIPIGQGLLGRIVNPLCQPIDDQRPIIGEKELMPIEKTAPPFIERVEITKPLETGIMMVDLLVPIGEGQRELIIGDAKTGKTIFPLQVLASQSKKGTICIYVGIRKKDIAIRIIEDYLRTQGVLNQAIIINTTPDDSSTLSYLAPYSGMSIAEYFKDKGQKVIIVFDDLTTHAKIYREISLLLKRSPGRDSYPGDIFHIHAALLERAGNFKNKENSVCITALPVAETLENDLSGYVQTNLMAMTDGHIFFDVNAFRKGKRPAINAFISVSRVGNQTKSFVEKEIASWSRKKILEYQRISEIAQFGTELTAEANKALETGRRLEILFNQGPQITIPRNLQIVLSGLLISGFWDDKSTKRMEIEINKILEHYYKKTKDFALSEKIKGIKDLNHLKFLIKQILPKINKIIF